MILWFVVAPLCLFAPQVIALDPIEVVGNKFFKKDGSQFFIKGVAYQLRPEDPLTDEDQCRRDIELMKVLGNNALRVYHVDHKANHDGCMNAFEEAGIYLLIDLDTFDTYITPSNNCWSSRQYNRFKKVMDAFAKYPNTLAFFVGNENIAINTDSPGAPFLKAAARDMKSYRDSKKYRKIPVGYSAADIKPLRPMLQNYLACGDDPSEAVDFFSLNSYSWCDPSTFESSSYVELFRDAKNLSVPIFFSETGCNVPGPRLWEDQDAIFGNMTSDWSGAIVYEWIQEQNKYGLISYGPEVGDPGKSDESVFDNWTRKGTPTAVSPDFDNLKTKWANAKPTGVSKADYDTNKLSAPSCPTSTAGGWWQVDGDVRLPDLDETVTTPLGPHGVHKKTATSETETINSATSAKPTGLEKAGDEAGNKDIPGDEGTGMANKENFGVIICSSLGAIILGLAVWL